MGKIEKKVKRDIYRTKIHSAIIKAIAISGVIAVGVVAPNILGALGKAGFINPHQKKQNIKKSLSRLMQHGYVELKSENGQKRVRLTQKGERYAGLLGEGKLAPKKPKRWDKKWRVLIFDIPEKRRKVRTQVRTTLLILGFCRLQDSVWVYPYDCEDIITLLKADFHIGKDLLYIVADTIEYDLPLREHFNLV